MKLMISVGKGEKSMRLWNLVTGKKAGVLNFERDILNEAGEGKFTSGEGRKVAWGATGAEDEFCVAFDKGAIIYGMDSKPKCKVVPQPRNEGQKWTKIHQLCYVSVGEEEDTQMLALSTEDGRILFYSTRAEDLESAPAENGKEAILKSAKLVAILDGSIAEEKDRDAKTAGTPTRIKDFAVLNVGEGSAKSMFIVAGRSDGTLQLFQYSATDLVSKNDEKAKQIGKLLGSYKTGNRITCLKAFVMLPKYDGEDADENFDDFEGFDDEVENGSDDSSSEDE
jgi:protein MAK11